MNEKVTVSEEFIKETIKKSLSAEIPIEELSLNIEVIKKGAKKVLGFGRREQVNYLRKYCSDFELGRIAFVQGQFKIAEKYYKKAIESKGAEKRIVAMAWNNLAVICNDLDIKEEYYLKALEADDQFDKAWFNLGATYINKGEDKFVNCFNKSIEIGNGEGWLKLMYLIKISKNEDLFEKMCNVKIQNEQLYKVLYFQYPDFILEGDDMQKSLSMIIKLLGNKDINIENWSNVGKGLYYFNTGEHNKARDCFEEVLKDANSNDEDKKIADKQLIFLGRNKKN